VVEKRPCVNIREMRDVKQRTPNTGEGLFRTLSIAMMIGAVMGFVAMAFPLVRLAPAGSGVSYYLPWFLPYGIVNFLIAFAGVFFTTLSKEKPGLYFPGDILGIVSGALLALEGLPIGIFLGNVEFCISMIVIGACIIVIGALGISALKEERR